MVHLASVKKDHEVVPLAYSKLDAIETIPAVESDVYTGNVYGSRFTAEHLPQHEMPEGEMPRQVAAHMIKDGQSYVHPSISLVLTSCIGLSLDGNPRLNLASFCSSKCALTFLIAHCTNPLLFYSLYGGGNRTDHGRFFQQELHRLRRIPPYC